ncbi:MAG: TonB-dependent receptor [Paludibacteraceae bacterium]|nr:TonB-dependent receptor [Paludibacteraceae bacterium]
MKNQSFNVQRTSCDVRRFLGSAMCLVVLLFSVQLSAQTSVSNTLLHDDAFGAAGDAQVSNQDTAVLTILMRQLEDVVVTAPVMQTTVSKQEMTHAELNRDNTGQNLPYLLSVTPALVATSDDGLGVGYTYFRVRGTDHTRINITVNDVPLNDGESQTVFWVNMTDISSSMSSINVQRGVGTSTNGSASFGASLNMRTDALPAPVSSEQDGSEGDRSRLTLAFNGGMYNTFREMVNAHVVLPGRWKANARFSKVNSDGFLYHSNSDLYSYFGDLGWYGKRTEVVARIFGGKEKTAQAWEGVDYNTAYGINGADRRYNPADSLNWDLYAQQNVQIAVTHRFTTRWSMNATLHYTHGKGDYEQYKKKKYSYWGLDDSGKTYGFYQKWLENHFAGAVLSAKYISENVDAQFGAAANDYIGAHWGILDYLATPSATALPFHYEYYRNSANKIDANTYAKANWRILNRAQEKLSLYADLQYRFIRYSMKGISDDSMMELPLSKDFHFFNPKAGLTYQNRGHLLAGSFAIANREPSRANYTENIYYDKTTESYVGKMPEAERLYDYELGYSYSHRRFHVGLNLYFMDYDNQLVLTGEYNDVGQYKTMNVKDSYRMGAELTAGVKITDWFSWEGNMVVSRNKIQNYKQYIDLYDDQDNWNWVGQDSVVGEATIAFSPTITAMSLFTFDYAGFVGTIQTNVVGKQYLDNSMDKNAMLRAYTTTNVNLQYSLPVKSRLEKRRRIAVPDVKLLCQINNIFNSKYAGNGGAESSRFADGSRCVWYYAQAGINVHAGFVITW